MRRITISVPDEVLGKAQRAVETGAASSVSSYFVEIARRQPDWSAGRRIVDGLVDEIGGLSPESVDWARASLGLPVETADSYTPRELVSA